jgi:hypothetical protein
MPANEAVVAVLIPLAAFSMSVAIVGLVGYFNHQARKQRHETIRLALEKGQPLPPELLAATRPARSDLSSGIQWIFVGVGLGLFLWFFRPEHSLWAVGLILVFVGLGKLVAHAVTSRASPAALGGPSA